MPLHLKKEKNFDDQLDSVRQKCPVTWVQPRGKIVALSISLTIGPARRVSRLYNHWTNRPYLQ